MIIGYILGGFIIYFLYRFIVGFILPVVRTTSAMKRKMEEMRQPYQTNEHRNESNKVHAAQPGNTTGRAPGTNDVFGKFHHAADKPAKSDYIDFEEIKEDHEMNRP